MTPAVVTIGPWSYSEVIGPKSDFYRARFVQQVDQRRLMVVVDSNPIDAFDYSAGLLKEPVQTLGRVEQSTSRWLSSCGFIRASQQANRAAPSADGKMIVPVCKRVPCDHSVLARFSLSSERASA